MTLRKRTSPTLKNAQARLAAIEAINPKLDLGSGISVVDYSAKIEEASRAIADYNKALLAIEQTSSIINDLERSLASYSTRMLSGVATIYGRTSSEYRMTSGPKKRRKPAGTPAAEAIATV
jgi:hypothetical protein